MPAFKDLDIDKIRKKKGIKKEVFETYKTLKRFAGSEDRNKWVRRRNKNWDAISENKMWDDKTERDMEKAGQVPLVINDMAKGVQGSSAIVTDSKPEIKFYPIGSGDLYVAELLKRGHDVVWAENEGNDETYDVVEESKIGGMAFYKGYLDTNKGVTGKVTFHAVQDPTCFYWDRASERRDLSDTDIIEARYRTRSYIKENYGMMITEDDLTFENIPEMGEIGESSSVTGADNYTTDTDDSVLDANEEPKDVPEIEAWIRKVETKYFFIGENEDGVQEPENFDLPAGVTMDTFKQQLQKDQGFKKVTVTKQKIEHRILRIIVGSKLIAEKVDPYGFDAEDNPICGVVALKHNRTRSSYPTCPSDKALDLNKERNKRRSQIIYGASQELSAPIVKDAKTKWLKGKGSRWELEVAANTALAPFRLNMTTGSLSALVALEDKAHNDINDIYDLHDVMRGKVPPGQENASGRLVLALQDMGGMMSKPYLRKLESAMVRLAKLNLAIMLRSWPYEKWRRLIEDDELMQPPKESNEPPPDDNDFDAKGEIAQKWIDALERIRPQNPLAEPAIKMVDIDVRISAGSSLPTNRMAKAQVAAEMLQAGVYDAEAALEYIDDPSKDKIIKRMKENQQLQLLAGAKK